MHEKQSIAFRMALDAAQEALLSGDLMSHYYWLSIATVIKYENVQ